jgi:hypothetical protein
LKEIFFWCEISPKCFLKKLKNSHIVPFFSLENLQKFEKKILKFFSTRLHYYFNFVAFRKLVSKLFKQVFIYFFHLMLNPSWDVTQCCNIKKMKKNH